MATDTQKYSDQSERRTHHSALEEFSRDERRPAVLLLSALVIAVLFFTLGLLVGRWTAEPGGNAASAPSSTSPSGTNAPSTSNSTTPAQATNAQSVNSSAQANANASASEGRFSLLVATYATAAQAETLAKYLESAGYKDVRTTKPRRGDTRQAFSVLVGRLTRNEADEVARRMRSDTDARLKNARVIESNGQ